MQPHALLVPFPETGHINPLMQLARHLASHGILITFVNTRYNHERILQSNAGRLPADLGLPIRLVAIPDTLSDDINRDNDIFNMNQIVKNVGPALENLIDELAAAGDRITCIISDALALQTLEICKKVGVPRVAFWPPSISIYALCCHSAYAAYNGSLPRNGIPRTDEMVTFPELPSLPGWALPWTIGDEVINEHAFKLISESMTACSESDWILGNFIRELEASALSEIPPHFKHPTMVGPILPVNVLQRTSTSENMLTMSLWVEEDTCLHWLNAQKPKSVLYVSLGSVATVKKDQLQELALGLEAAGLATLWVVREDLTGEKGTSLPEGFLQRTQERIRIVSWSPQLLVLSHGAVGGFLTHCGWNSIIEALSMGVPLLAWPQLGDQYMNAEVSVTKWGAGLKLNDFEKKLVRREHVAIQVKKLMLEHAGEVARSRAEEIRDQILKAVGEGGSSYNNLQGFVRWVKHQAGPTINIGSLLSA